ncbi:MAG: biosynthetic-type acetolactate synthase large subunit [Candidatus Caenarcaniphilales bacterium]|nr:biosynthetic-type acetolactate synthase large subunit [Candidatus Caenarcaniphilales bacterium]
MNKDNHENKQEKPIKCLGSQSLLNTLEKNSVKTIFGYPGGVLLGLYDQIYAQDKIRHVLVRHEQGAAHAADGYARVAGKPGVCLATSGPGATNLLTGICSAHMDSIPIIALTGQVPSAMIGKDAFQEADLFNLSLPITKHNYLVKETSKIPQVINESFTIAQSGRPGPVLVDLPKDILNTEFEWSTNEHKVELPGLQVLDEIDINELKKAIQMIEDAEKPVLYIGGGVVSSRAHKQILELAERFSLPIVWTLMGKGAVSDEHPLNLGMLGMHGTPTANFAIYESDLLIAIGVRFDDRATGKLEAFAPKAKVIHIDIDPAEIGKNRKLKPFIDISLLGDAKEVLNHLLEVSKEKEANRHDWLKQLRQWDKDYPLDDKEHEEHITPKQVFRILNEIAEDAIFTTDVGQHQMWAAQYIKSKNPGRWITSGGLGTMGFGLPAAIGAKAAAQDLGINEPVICITGDGSFQMCLQEIGTMVAHNLPVVVVILNNGNLGMVRQWQELFFNRNYSFSDLQVGSPDYVKLAESYGIKGLRTDSADDLESILKEAIGSAQPVIVDLQMHPEANVYPIVPAGGANHRAEGIGIPTVPSNRSKEDYQRSVEIAPVNKVSNFVVKQSLTSDTVNTQISDSKSYSQS